MSKDFEVLQSLKQPQADVISTDDDRGSRARSSGTAMPARMPNIAPRTYEQLNKLVQRVFLAGSSLSRLIAFTGSGPGVGCTWIAVRTAEVLCSQIQNTVCLIETHTTGVGLREHFSVDEGLGFEQALLDRNPICDYVKQAGPNLWVLPGGGCPSQEVIHSAERVESRLLELRREFDFILVDLAPIGAALGTAIMARHSDGVVLVLKAGCTKRDETRLAIQGLKDAEAKVLGAVLNQREYPIPGYLYDRL